MKTILWFSFVGIMIERLIKYRVKKTDANTSGILDSDRIVTSVKDLWDMK